MRRSSLMLGLLPLLLPGCGGGGGAAPVPSPSPVPPIILQQPLSQTVDAGQVATFSVGAERASGYQWQEDGVDIPGATGPSYATPPASPTMDGHLFHARISGPGGTLLTQDAALGVRYLALVAQPADATGLEGATANFSVQWSARPGGIGDVQGQWQRSPDGTAWTDLEGATGPILSVGPVRFGADQGARFRVRLQHPTGTYTSNAATLSVGAVEPTITAQPRDLALHAGQVARFSAAYAGTQGRVAWQVRRSGGPFEDLPDSAGPSYAFTAQLGDSGNQYRFVVINPKGSAASSPATLTVDPAPVAPTFTVQPVDQTVPEGQSATFAVAAVGFPVPSLQWSESTDGLAWADLSGAVGSTLVWAKARLVEGGTRLRCTARNSEGSAESAVVILHVASAPAPPAFTVQPADQTVTAGGTATFACAATGNPAPALQWERSDDRGATWSALPGRNGGSLVLTGVQIGDAGAYVRCRAVNASGTVLSRTAALAVSPQPTFRLDVVMGAGVSGSPASGGSYPQGAQVAYSFDPQTGFQDLVVTLDGAPVPPSGTLSLDRDHVLSASATPRTFTVTFLAGPGGHLGGAATQTVVYGGSTTAVTATAEAGSTFVNWTGPGLAPSTEDPLVLAHVSQNLVVTANFAVLAPATGLYGPALQADALANTRIGGPYNTRSAYRFRCDHDGSLSALRFYLVKNGSRAGYSGGTGGILRVELHGDDGSAAHGPSPAVLASLTLADPLNAGDFPFRLFASPVLLQKGQLYHLVFLNVDPDPVTNYVSINSLYLQTPVSPMQPRFSDADWAQLLASPSDGFQWHPRSTTSGYTPILELDYADGYSTGMGYMEVWVTPTTGPGGQAQGGPKPISGASGVREVFTVSGPDLRCTSLSIRLARGSGGDPLGLRLEDGSGRALLEGSLPASAFGAAAVQATWAFPKEVRLASGATYRLVLSAPASSVYTAFPIRKGKESYLGFQASTYFADGHAEWSPDGSAWSSWDQWGSADTTGDGDLQFAFAADPAGPPPPPLRALVELPMSPRDPKSAVQALPGLEATPFDGTVVAPVGDLRLVFRRAMPLDSFEQGKLAEARTWLPQLRSGRIRNNFLLVRGSGDPGWDWFSDAQWVDVETNLRTLAGLAQLGALRGIAFDPEAYGSRLALFKYGAQPQASARSFDAYRAQVRLRGAQFLRALRGVNPACEVWSLGLLSFVRTALDQTRGDASALQARLQGDPYGLLPSFLAGLLDADSRGLTDANETTYDVWDPALFNAIHATIRQAGPSALPPERQASSWSVRIGDAVFLNWCLDLQNDPNLLPHYTDTAAQRLQLLEHAVYHALRSSDELTFVYSESLDVSRTLPVDWALGQVPPGAADALARAKAKLLGGQSLGFDVGPFMTVATQRWSHR